MTSTYFYFLPILSADCSWSAFRWQACARSNATLADFSQCFNDAAAAPLANLMPLVVTAAQSWFDEATPIEKFDANLVIIVLPASVLNEPQILERCRKLHAQGYHLGLNVDAGTAVRHIPLAGFDHLQLDANFTRCDLAENDLTFCSDAGFRKISTHVTTHEMFEWLSGKDFDLFDCNFLTVRNPHCTKDPDLTRLKMLKLLSLVEKDGNTHEIEAIFREEPKLSYNLLRLVNSVAVGARTRISSFSQAIAILGRRQLQRWLQLLIYANNLAEGNTPNPLMQIAAARGRLLELLSGAIEPKPDLPELSDKAFITGLFSLLEVLLHMPMDQILKELPLHDEVTMALKSPAQGGLLGQLLLAITAGESGDFETAENLLSSLGISPEIHAKAQVAAYYWAARINDSHHED
jgi:EAL and modified HD-GYP domain-containing signal transduction protein